MDTTQGTLTLYDIFISKFGPEVKSREGNNIRQVCPQCGHKSLSCNIQNGLINCFQCQYGRGLKFTGQAGGFVESPVDFELHLAVSRKLIELSSLLPVHKEYLVKRGISNPDEFQIKSVPFRVDQLLLNHFTLDQLISSGYFYKTTDGYSLSRALNSRRVLIPYWSGNEIIGIKSRIRPYADVLEDEQRYICPKGSKIKSQLWYKGPLGSDVITTEGELCAMATQQAGFPAIGIPGLGQITANELNTSLKNLLNKYGVLRNFIILDTDPNISTDPGKLTCALTLYKASGNTSNGPRGCILYLPQDTPEEGMDLDLYLSRYKIQDLIELMENAWHKRQAVYNGLVQRVKGLKCKQKLQHKQNVLLSSTAETMMNNKTLKVDVLKKLG